MSQASCEVLIEVVIQAIPTYAMGCFRIPLGHCHEIETKIKKVVGPKRRKKKDPLVEGGGINKTKIGGRHGV